jgi:hypothetical protein
MAEPRGVSNFAPSSEVGVSVVATESKQHRQHANKLTRNLSSVICHSAFRPVTLTSSVMISPSSQIKAIPPSRRGVSESL